jgi:hypothetical protein
VKAAADLYGVIIDPATYEIDHAATQRRRSRSADFKEKRRAK